MLDQLKFETELERIRLWDNDQVTYYYEVDTLLTSGKVRKNICGRRKTGADNLEADILSVARDSSAVEVYISYYNGKERSTTRKDRKLTGTDKPDITLRLTAQSPPAVVSEKTPTQDRQINSDLFALLGIQGLSGVDALNGIVSARVEDARKEFELDRLRERLVDAQEAKARAERENYDLRKECEKLEEMLEEMRSDYEEAKKYNPETMSGVGRLVFNLAQGAVGNIAKSYARRNPDRVMGLFGPAVLEMLTDAGGDAEPTPTEPEREENPHVAQIHLWLRAQRPQTITNIYELVCAWDQDPDALARSLRAARGNDYTNLAEQEEHETH